MRRTPARVTLARLPSTREIVDVLGGVPAVRALTGANVKAIYHWINVGMFPARYYDLMKRTLKRRGYTAPARLWNQISEKKAA
jgi:hypothetical protein